MERLKHLVQINLLIGLWLVIAPFLLGEPRSTAGLASDVATGVLLIGCSWWMLAGRDAPLVCSALQLLGGLWLLAAPFSLHYDRLTRGYRNDVVAGVAVVLLSATTAWMLSTRLRRHA